MVSEVSTKNRKHFMRSFVILLLAVISTPVLMLSFGHEKVIHVLFIGWYLLKRTVTESDIQVVRESLIQGGWTEGEQMGGMYTFERNGETKIILNTQTKTVFVTEE